MRRQAPLVRPRPDLQEMRLLVLIAVVLAVPDARARARELHLAALEVLDVAETVLVLERPGDDVRPDEEFSVGVRAEACGGRDAVLVDNAEGPEGCVALVVVRGEGKGMEGIEPVVVGVAAGRPGPLCEFERGAVDCRHGAED